MVELSTLTGAIIVSLGHERAGLFSNNTPLSNRLREAGSEIGEKLWRMPLGPKYDKLIDCEIADMKNVGNGRDGGSITAAQFLQRFVQEGVAWAHLDIAGMAWSSKGNETTPKGATAFGVRLLDRWVADNYEKLRRAMATEVNFYHLTKSSLEDALPRLLLKTLQAGERAVVMLGSPERVDALNTHLWTYDPNGFLPHGSARDGEAERQPVWLTHLDENPNGAAFLFVADRARSDRVGRLQALLRAVRRPRREAVAEAASAGRPTRRPATRWSTGSRPRPAAGRRRPSVAA